MTKISQPLVSIGISFLNSEEYLEKSILSVINQTYSNWELLLIDDGSTDSSLKIAKSFLDDSRVSVISDGLNKGLHFRLNELIQMAKGKYFCRMDADDIMMVNRIDTQVQYLLLNENVDVIGSHAYSIDNNDRIYGYRGGSNNSIKSYKEVLFSSMFIHPTVMGKLSWFLDNLYRDYNRMEDYELWLRTYNSSVFRIQCIPLLFYREFGIPNFSKYFQTKKSQIKYILFKKDLSFLLRFQLIIRFIMQVICFRLLSYLKKDYLILNKRSTVISENEEISATYDLKKAIVKMDCSYNS